VVAVEPTGRSLATVGSVIELARDLQPAVVVMEDVDLVAADRSFGPAGSPVLFDLLDAMDGAAPDAELLFVFTTNRAHPLEPALAARPGRVDVAVEIGPVGDPHLARRRRRPGDSDDPSRDGCGELSAMSSDRPEGLDWC
jgi:ATP-dependent 26S proteasome regulatory subunit